VIARCFLYGMGRRDDRHVRLIGHEHEWRRLEGAADRARDGGGGLVPKGSEAALKRVGNLP